jgi:hypothetical protein
MRFRVVGLHHKRLYDVVGFWSVTKESLIRSVLDSGKLEGMLSDDTSFRFLSGLV